MNSDFRQRVLLPVLLPFGVLAAILVIAVSLSRVLLAVPATTAAFVALGIASYVLFLGFLIERRTRISSRALAVGTTLGLAAIIGAGTLSAIAGPRQEEVEGAEEGGGTQTGEVPDASSDAPLDVAPEGAVVFAAGDDIAWDDVPDTIPAGTSPLALELTGNLQHNVVIEGVNGDQPIVDGAAGPGFYVNEVELAPGTYTYYCAVPGHRSNMEGEVEVS